MAQNKVQAITRITLAGTSLTSSYQALNAGGLGQACFRVSVSNTTNAAIDVSYDGTNDHDVVLVNTTTEVSSQTNAQPNALVALFGKSQVVYVKGSAGAGNIYLVGYYVPQSLI